MQLPLERLGSFFLGAEYDLENNRQLPTPINYDARDLTTHAVCVGMTGSGKTGLCIGLLEEAAIDKVPIIIIDPKGDMTNLLLQFPDMLPGDFEPWINPDDARRKGKSAPEYAADVAELWRNGLANWGIDSERIKVLQATTDFSIYTPGSEAGLPISILGSLAAPRLDFTQHAEAIRERIGGTVVALLGLVGIKADPIRSREAILLSNIFEHFWAKNEDMDLAKLILSIQNPPVRQLGVFDVDTFYPEKDRFEMAMTFNNLMAAPSFKSWLKGDALDIDSLYYTADGKPRTSIFYIAHLSESERMFFVTLLLENILTWMRQQTGTTSLRALLYFDEVFGFFPPTAEPPSKRPLLTLLKQARAFGLGTILVTQNPVDIDYKGLTNAGTWFIGKLQAERDKARVLQGLRGAIAEAGAEEKVDYNTLINQLGSRVFLMHNVHDERPVVFHTRWVMSYLRGPLTKPQVTKLIKNRQTGAPAPVAPRMRTSAAAVAPSPATPAPKAEPEPVAPIGFSPNTPTLDPTVPQVYVPLEVSRQTAARQLADDLKRQFEIEQVQLIYEAAIIGGATVRFFDRKRKIDEKAQKLLLSPAPDDLTGVNWNRADLLPISLDDLVNDPEQVGEDEGPFFAPVPEEANNAREFKSIGKNLSDWLYYNSRLSITTHPQLGIFQQPGEDERQFKIRLQQAARERRDEEVDKLEEKYENQIDRLEAKLRKSERELEADKADYDARKQQEMVGIGESIFSLFAGRRNRRALSSAAGKRRMTTRAKLEVEETKDEIADFQEELIELEQNLQEAAAEITAKWDDLLDDLATEEITPRRTDVNVRLTALAWLPSWLITYNSRGQVEASTIAAYALPE